MLSPGDLFYTANHWPWTTYDLADNKCCGFHSKVNEIALVVSVMTTDAERVYALWPHGLLWFSDQHQAFNESRIDT
jgi:hypothetical protein